MSRSEPYKLSFRDATGEFVVSFQAMAGPCEVLVQSHSGQVAREVGDIVYQEAHRIEAKFSRYLEVGVIHQIHQHKPVKVDEETARLLNFAKTAYELSDGNFDISSGILRKLWDFTGKGTPPSRAQVKALLAYVGWEKIKWDGETIVVPEGMEIDFGGFAKEYAVDQALRLAGEAHSCPLLVNFGGDLAANRAPLSREQWGVGILGSVGSGGRAAFRFQSGAIATSGNANRYIMHKGKKLSHILNPRTGWPVSQAPLSVSVGMGNCLQAGLISTLAILRGKNAEAFLEAQEVTHWVQR